MAYDPTQAQVIQDADRLREENARLRTLARELYGALDRLRKAAWSTMPDDVAFFDADDALHRAREAGIGGGDAD